MYKDLDHLNLTIYDKFLGVASHFLQLFMPWAHCVNIDILLMRDILPAARNEGEVLFRLPQRQSVIIMCLKPWTFRTLVFVFANKITILPTVTFSVW